MGEPQEPHQKPLIRNLPGLLQEGDQLHASGVTPNQHKSMGEVFPGLTTGVRLLYMCVGFIAGCSGRAFWDCLGLIVAYLGKNKSKESRQFGEE